MLPQLFVSAHCVRHAPVNVELVMASSRPEARPRTYHTRYVKRHGLLLECPGGLEAGQGFVVGERLEMGIKFFPHESTLSLSGVVEHVVPFCQGLEGEVLGLVTVRFVHLTPLVIQKLDAYVLLTEGQAPSSRPVRVPVRLPTEVKGLEVFTQLTLKDLSMTGVFVETQAKPGLGKRVELRFVLPQSRTPIHVVGRVVWQGPKRGQAGFGLAFDALDSHVRYELAQFLSRSMVFPAL